MMRKFHGTYHALQDRVNLTGFLGQWRDRGNHKQFISDDGAVLNWWESSHTLLMQGREPGKTSLEIRFGRGMVLSKPRIAVGPMPKPKNQQVGLPFWRGRGFWRMAKATGVQNGKVWLCGTDHAAVSSYLLHQPIEKEEAKMNSHEHDTNATNEKLERQRVSRKGKKSKLSKPTGGVNRAEMPDGSGVVVLFAKVEGRFRSVAVVPLKAVLLGTNQTPGWVAVENVLMPHQLAFGNQQPIWTELLRFAAYKRSTRLAKNRSNGKSSKH